MSFKTYAGKTVLVTGHTGFKGSWLSMWLKKLGANVIGVSDNIPTNPSNFIASNIDQYVQSHTFDICNEKSLTNLIKHTQPDFIFHLAAQALVRPSYESPVKTITTNALGTANVLETIRLNEKPIVAIMITSDKAYDNVEWMWGYRENDRLGGKDPYSASKGMAELVIRSYVESFFKTSDSNIRIGITRAGNVIGGGDWAADRIVPDCMNAWSRNKEVDIRNLHATRPWQHVMEPLSGYLTLGSRLYHDAEIHGEAYNFGPPASQNYTVHELINEMTNHWDNVRWNNVPKSEEIFRECSQLKLNCDKALFDLNWLPTLHFEETVSMTVKWYKEFYENKSNKMHDYTLAQIDQYTALAKERGAEWANL
jgi:CDP-glucose 4,6-dehydratase